MPDLVGKFIFLDEGETYVLEEVCPGSTEDVLLIQPEPINNAPVAPKRLIVVPMSWEDLLIFDNHEAFTKWWAWIEEVPSGPKVVSITKKRSKD